MRKIILSTGLLIGSLAFAQKATIEPFLKDKISIRAIQLWNGKIWYSGTESKFGYVSLKDTLDKKQLKLSDKKLQFRTLAQDAKSFYAINIESPAYFFRIDKRDLKNTVISKDDSEKAFYDALYFYQNKFYTFSDANPDLKLKFRAFSMPKGVFTAKDYSDISLKEGEAAFAASNSNIVAKGNYVWLATGGMASRIFRLNLKTDKIEIFDTPIVQGTSSQGIYSIDFANETFGIAVGGDYTKQKENINNIATTNDGGVTWQVQASGQNGGYMTCVKIKPGSNGKEIIAVGDQHISYSRDFGKTWKIISEEKNLYACEWVDKNTVVLAGNNRIVKMKIAY